MTPTSTSDHDTVEPPRAGSRPALPWTAVVGATMLATLAAVIVLVLLRDDDPVSSVRAETPITLTPADEVDTDDPLEISFTRLDGSEGTLADEIDGPTVVNFFASWCPPCIGEMPDFEAASQALGDEVRFVGLAVQDRPEDAERIVERTGITYDWARDIRGDIAGAVGVIQMPTTMFIAADGTIVAVQSGAVDEDRLLDLVEEHLGVTS